MELNYEKVAGEILSLKRVGDKAFWITLSKRYNMSGDALRSWFNREKRKRSALETLLEEDDSQVEDFDGGTIHGEEDSPEQSDYDYRAKTETKFDDSGNIKYISSDRLVKMSNEEEKSPDFVLMAHGFDPKLWSVVSIVNNFWQGMRKNDLGAATLYQSKLTVKPKTENKNISLSDVDNFFENFKSENVLANKDSEVVKEKTGKTLIINLADLHFGNEEKNYPTKDKVLNLLNTIKTKIIKNPVQKILVVNLGDALHVDTEGGTTTSGTQVGERGTVYLYWEEALISLINFISELSSICPVEYLSVSGNHDRVNSYTLSKSLEYAFSRNKDNVLFDVSFSHRKYKVIGNSLLGFTHGDMPNKNQAHILQNEERLKFGQSKHAYLFMGHLHHISIKDEQGVIISTLPSVTSTDYWHEQNGYVGAWRGTFCYIVDDEEGVVETWHISA